MAQIYLVRHTKVDVAPGICYGLSDVPLAPTFFEEAEEIQQKLQGIPFDKIYSSPLSRCTKLANILTHQKFTTDSRLAELNFGEWEYKTWDDIYESPYGKLWMDNYQELPCLSGESYRDLHNRVTAFIDELDKNKNTLIVTHAGVIRVFLSIFKKIPLSEVFNVPVGFGEVVEIWNKTSQLV